MAKKARKKSKAKKRKKSTAPARKARKAVVRRKAAKKTKKVARRKPAPKAKPKSVVGKIVGAAEAVVETLSEAEQLHHKMEPHISPDPE